MIKSSNNGMFTVPTAPSTGTTVAQNASANTFTATAVQMLASTAEPDFIVAVRYSLSTTSAPTYLSILIGTGPSVETTVGIVNCPPIGAWTTVPNASVPIITGRVELPAPIPVANATRIACKTASDVASALSWKIWLEMYKQADLIDAGVIEQADVQTIKTQAVTCPAGVTVGAFVGNATAAIAVDANGRLDVIKVNGTSQTARDLGAQLDATVSSRATVPGVWQDATPGDFTTSGSAGQRLFRTPNVAAGADGGLMLGGASQDVALRSLTVINSTGDAVMLKSSDALGSALHIWSTQYIPLYVQADGIAQPAAELIANGAGGQALFLQGGVGAADLYLARDNVSVGGRLDAAVGSRQATVTVDGKSLQAALQIIAAACAGLIADAGSSQEHYKGLDGATTRYAVTVDANGNRTAVSYP